VSAVLRINEKGIFSLLKTKREKRETKQGKGGAMTGTVFVIITRGREDTKGLLL